MLSNPIPLPLEELAPAPELFAHHSRTHGQAHVARVLVHAFRLVALTGREELAVPLWAAVYLHDLARTHDGTCGRHGRDAAARLDHMPETIALFSRGGLQGADLPAVTFAVSSHTGAPEVAADHPHGPLTRLLKDADALDRVRLGDLDPRYFRHPETRSLVPFAERLYAETDGIVPTGPDHFSRLWPVAARLSG